MDINISNPNTYTIPDLGITDIRKTGNPSDDCNYSYTFIPGCHCVNCRLRCGVHSKIIGRTINQSWSRMAKSTWSNTARHRFKTM